MKKAISLVLALVMCLSLCACGSESKTPKQKTTIPQATEPEQIWGWSVEPILDDFGDPTGEFWLCGLFPGKFSNTATTDAELVARIYYRIRWSEYGITEDLIFNMLEYGDHQAFFSEYEKPEIKMKDDDGEVISTSGSYSSSVYFSQYGRAMPYLSQGRKLDGDVNGQSYFLSMFENELYYMVMKEGYHLNYSPLSVIVKGDNSTYEFSVDCTGWEEGITKLVEGHGFSYEAWHESRYKDD